MWTGRADRTAGASRPDREPGGVIPLLVLVAVVASLVVSVPSCHLFSPDGAATRSGSLM